MSCSNDWATAAATIGLIFAVAWVAVTFIKGIMK